MYEIYMPIENYEDTYAVSNLGNVKNIKTGRILKPTPNAKGYLVVDLWKNNKRKHYKVHRLVISAFKANSENKPTVDHVDRNRQNNNLNNLRYATYKEQAANQDNSNRNNQIKATSKPVICHDTMKVYPSANEAIRDLQIKATSAVAKCCKSGGLVYSYKLSNYVSFSYFTKQFDYDNYFETGESKYNANLDEYETDFDDLYDDDFIF